MKKVDFKTSGYFSSGVIFAGIVFSFAGLAFLFSNPVIGLILVFASIIIFTTHYRLTIDFEKKEFHDYLWILGLKSGEKGEFERIDYLFVKKSRTRQSMSMRAANTTIHKEVFDGYLRFSEDEKIHLITKDNRKDVMARLQKIGTLLKINVVDYTTDEPAK